MLKLDELFRNQEIFIISLFSIFQIGVESKNFFLQFSVLSTELQTIVLYFLENHSPLFTIFGFPQILGMFTRGGIVLIPVLFDEFWENK